MAQRPFDRMSNRVTRIATRTLFGLSAFAAPVAAQDAGADVDLRSFDAAWRIINATHFDTTFNGVDWAGLRDSLRPLAVGADRDSVRRLIRGMLGRLGQSHFSLVPQDAADRNPSGGDGAGTVGIQFRLVDRRILVTQVEPGSAAEAAGIRTGWAIESVDTMRVAAALEALEKRPSRYSMDLRAWGLVTGWLDGRPGDSVSVEFRDAAERSVSAGMERRPSRALPVKFGDMPVFYATFDSERREPEPGFGVGLITFSSWMVPLVRQVDSAVNALRDARGMILDLRGNRGGVGAMVMGVAGHFTATRDTLGSMRSRSGTLRFVTNPRMVSPGGLAVRPFDGPVAILQDALSGSASEVFAGGMQAIGRARVFGATSLGGVLPASWDRLPNGDVLYHAIADFVTSDGVLLEGRGVIPDEPVTVTRDDLLGGRDPVLDAAIRWIRSAARTQGGSR